MRCVYTLIRKRIREDLSHPTSFHRSGSHISIISSIARHSQGVPASGKINSLRDRDSLMAIALGCHSVSYRAIWPCES